MPGTASEEKFSNHSHPMGVQAKAEPTNRLNNSCLYVCKAIKKCSLGAKQEGHCLHARLSKSAVMPCHGNATSSASGHEHPLMRLLHNHIESSQLEPTPVIIRIIIIIITHHHHHHHDHHSSSSSSFILLLLLLLLLLTIIIIIIIHRHHHHHPRPSSSSSSSSSSFIIIIIIHHHQQQHLQHQHPLLLVLISNRLQ
jgi:hypothetical protein